MKLIDTYTDKSLTMQEVKNLWQAFRQDEPYNHAASFRIELFNILMASMNGRNDYKPAGYTGREISGIIERIRKTL